jgi:hypothetical protein
MRRFSEELFLVIKPLCFDFRKQRRLFLMQKRPALNLCFDIPKPFFRVVFRGSGL